MFAVLAIHELLLINGTYTYISIKQSTLPSGKSHFKLIIQCSDELITSLSPKHARKLVAACGYIATKNSTK